MSARVREADADHATVRVEADGHQPAQHRTRGGADGRRGGGSRARFKVRPAQHGAWYAFVCTREVEAGKARTCIVAQTKSPLGAEASRLREDVHGFIEAEPLGTSTRRIVFSISKMEKPTA